MECFYFFSCNPEEDLLKYWHSVLNTLGMTTSIPAGEGVPFRMGIPVSTSLALVTTPFVSVINGTDFGVFLNITNTVWLENFAGVLFCRLAILCGLLEQIFTVRDG